jgi:uncharacterized iron-regulated membrane protein
VRKVILNLHLFTASLAAAFIMVQGITGSILAFEPELDRVFHPHSQKFSSTQSYPTINMTPERLRRGPSTPDKSRQRTQVSDNSVIRTSFGH